MTIWKYNIYFYLEWRLVQKYIVGSSIDHYAPITLYAHLFIFPWRRDTNDTHDNVSISIHNGIPIHQRRSQNYHRHVILPLSIWREMFGLFHLRQQKIFTYFLRVLILNVTMNVFYLSPPLVSKIQKLLLTAIKYLVICISSYQNPVDEREIVIYYWCIHI